MRNLLKSPSLHLVAVSLAALGIGLMLLSVIPGIASRPDPPATEAPGASPDRSSGSSGSSGLAGFFGPDFDARRAFCTFTDPKASVAGGVLTVRFPAGSSAQSAGPPYGGAQICLPFAAGTTRTATLSYKVRFPVGFQFVKGGKLPGVYGGDQPFSGGDHNSNGWSMRLMWRTGGAGEVYAYTAATTGYGDEYGNGNFTWKADGQWHTVSETVTLNTTGAADGRVSVTYDGLPVITQDNVLITTTNTPIGGLFFSTFYGGDDNSWAPSADMQLDFKDFTTSPG